MAFIGGQRIENDIDRVRVSYLLTAKRLIKLGLYLLFGVRHEGWRLKGWPGRPRRCTSSRSRTMSYPRYRSGCSLPSLLCWGDIWKCKTQPHKQTHSWLLTWCFQSCSQWLFIPKQPVVNLSWLGRPLTSFLVYWCSTGCRGQSQTPGCCQ